nr:hypothetical protein [uncultured Chryseobacterium sp.]
MRKLIFIFLITILFSCNGQGNDKNSIIPKTTKTAKMQNIDINLWKEKATNYMKSLSESGENIVLDTPYYFLKETQGNKVTEFSGNDKEGYSLKETLPKPNIYNNIKFYRANGTILYSFKTLLISPNIVIGNHTEYDENGNAVKNEDYDEGFKSTPEKIIEFIKTHGGNIENELTIIDRQKNENGNTWYVEFLIPEKKTVKIFTLEDGTLKIVKSEERSSDFLED